MGSYIQLKVSYKVLRRPDGTFNRYLAEFLDRKVPASTSPVDGVATLDVLINRATGLWGRIFFESKSPSQQQRMEGEERRQQPDEQIAKECAGQCVEPHPSKPLLIFFHGGSFVHSSANSAIYDAMCRRLVTMCGLVVLSTNFRRAPDHRYPCAYDDGLMSVKWAQGFNGRSCLRSLGCDPINRCFLAGDSAGGNIAHNVVVRAVKEGIPIAGSVLLMPMFGGIRRTPAERRLDGKYFVTVRDRDWYWRAFLPVGADRDHPACNPFSISAPSLTDVSLPPCLVIVGGFDLLQDWQLNYAHTLQSAGKPVEVMFLEQATMGFFLLPNTNLFYTFVEGLRDFLNAHSPS